MKRNLIIASLAILGAGLCTDDAFAGRRHRGCCAPRPTCCAPAPSCSATPATTAPQPDAAPTPPAEAAPAPQASNTNGYQSFSYEPGTVPPSPAATAYVPAPRAQRVPNSFYDSIRADKKQRGY